MRASSQMWMENDEISLMILCNRSQLKSNYLVLCWQRLYVLAMVRAGILTACPKFAKANGEFAW